MNNILIATIHGKIIRVAYNTFYARGSVHRNSMWIKIQQMQQYADIYLL